MLRIRLQRTGRKNNACFRLVVAEKKYAVKGRFVEIVGHYLPTEKEKVFTAKKERVLYWISKGAIPTDSVARLLKKYENMSEMDKYIGERVMKPSKAEERAAEEAKKKAEEEAKAAEEAKQKAEEEAAKAAEEAPAEEAPAEVAEEKPAEAEGAKEEDKPAE